jgi:signal transduction histidine kinase
VNLIGHKLKLMNVELDLRLDENLPPIHCDASQMQQVLINLIMNAAEAAQGHPEAHVRHHEGIR